MPGAIKFTTFNDIDPNVWYTLSEERVDKYENEKWTSSLQIRDRDTGELAVFPANDHYWQFQPIDAKKGRYSLRCSETGIFKQLSVCYIPSEVADGKTQPCLADSHGGDEQMWDIADWGIEGNSTLRFINVKNGTDYWMDVHKGNPMFMSKDIDTEIYQPAQRWLIKSVKNVDDGGFSTRFTNPPTTATSAPASTTADSTTAGSRTTEAPPSSTSGGENNFSDPSSGGTSGKDSGGTNIGLAAGVGVGVGVAVIILGLGLFFWWRRRQRAKTPMKPHEEAHTPSTAPATAVAEAPAWSSPQSGYQYYAKAPVQPQELDLTTTHAYELPTKGPSHELN